MIFEKVLCYAFSLGVEELEANVEEVYNWPIELHTSWDSLTSLKLLSRDVAGCLFLEPRSGSFKNLTNLHLKRARITNLDPFSGFRVLDKLRLELCFIRTKGMVLNVHAAQLSQFTISCYDYINRCEFTAPKLRYFEWRGRNFPPLVTHEGGFPILDAVVIDYIGYCCQQDECIMFDDLLMTFNTLHNARSLTIFSSVVHLLTLFSVDGCSPFRKLKRLNLNFRYFRNKNFFQGPCGSLMELLEHVPGLKAYLLPKPHDAKCSVMVIDRLRTRALAVERAFASKAIQ